MIHWVFRLPTFPMIRNNNHQQNADFSFVHVLDDYLENCVNMKDGHSMIVLPEGEIFPLSPRYFQLRELVKTNAKSSAIVARLKEQLSIRRTRLAQALGQDTVERLEEGMGNSVMLLDSKGADMWAWWRFRDSMRNLQRSGGDTIAAVRSKAKSGAAFLLTMAATRLAMKDATVLLHVGHHGDGRTYYKPEEYKQHIASFVEQARPRSGENVRAKAETSIEHNRFHEIEFNAAELHQGGLIHGIYKDPARLRSATLSSLPSGSLEEKELRKAVEFFEK